MFVKRDTYGQLRYIAQVSIQLRHRFGLANIWLAHVARRLRAELANINANSDFHYDYGTVHPPDSVIYDHLGWAIVLSHV